MLDPFDLCAWTGWIEPHRPGRTAIVEGSSLNAGAVAGYCVSVAVVFSRALSALEAPLVRVEVHLANGLPSLANLANVVRHPSAPSLNCRFFCLHLPLLVVENVEPILQAYYPARKNAA